MMHKSIVSKLRTTTAVAPYSSLERVRTASSTYYIPGRCASTNKSCKHCAPFSASGRRSCLPRLSLPPPPCLPCCLFHLCFPCSMCWMYDGSCHHSFAQRPQSPQLFYRHLLVLETSVSVRAGRTRRAKSIMACRGSSRARQSAVGVHVQYQTALTVLCSCCCFVS